MPGRARGRPPNVDRTARSPELPRALFRTPSRTWEPLLAKDNRIHVMDEADVRREISRMAREIVERNGGTEDLVLMGVHRRGTQIAALIRAEIEKATRERLPAGSIDITLYRDDLGTIGPRPVVGESELPADGIDGKNVVLVDDVAYTGRTMRAAINELSDWGRPKRIQFCVLVDRGGRELPIQPDYTGRKVTVAADQRVEVYVPELDGKLGVDLRAVEPEAA